MTTTRTPHVSQRDADTPENRRLQPGSADAPFFDKTGIARSARIHHSGIHLRQQRKEIYPHLASLQGRQTGGSVETHQRNEINHYRKTAY